MNVAKILNGCVRLPTNGKNEMTMVIIVMVTITQNGLVAEPPVSDFGNSASFEFVFVRLLGLVGSPSLAISLAKSELVKSIMVSVFVFFIIALLNLRCA